MAVLVDENTKVICEGLTPSANRFGVSSSGGRAQIRPFQRLDFIQRGKALFVDLKPVSFITALFLCMATLTQAQEVGPGAQSPDPLIVPGLFRSICLNNLPSFANAEAQMLNSGLFLRNERTGTIYHQTLNFSGKIQQVEGQMQCSVVFYSDAPIETVQPMLEAARDTFQAETRAQYPDATIDTISATGDSAGFHRMAIFIDITQ